MRRARSVLSGILAFITLFSLILTLGSRDARAEGWTLGPVTFNSSAEGQALVLQSTFKAPASAGDTYILDTEVFDAGGSRVAQWFDKMQLTGGQSVTRRYTWQTAGLTSGTYQFRQGVFNSDWSTMHSWNNEAGSYSPGGQGYWRGVNLSGAEFGETKLPGVYGTDYIYPGVAELDYYKSKGMNLVRLPFRWERLQQTLFGSLDQEELGRIDAVVQAAAARDMKIILDPHNYARYRVGGVEYLIGSPQVPNSAFQDFWSKLAAYYNGNSGIYAYSLMNEPHDTNGSWKMAAQAGLNGIRQADTTRLVLVPGDGWSGGWTWQQFNTELILSDPSNNLMYEAHQYFDRNGSGRYEQSYDNSGAYPTIGVDRIQPFLGWLKANHLRGIVTEYGVPNNDPRWLTVLDNFLAVLDAEGISGTYWGGGPWWGNYALSSEPANGQDAPVMGVLTRHLGK